LAHHIPGPLYFEQLGATGIPMVFLHSTPDDHRLWMYQTAHFSSWYRTIAIDMAGYGRSPAVQKGVTMEDMAAACWEAVDRVSGDAVIIHGNSMGGSVTQRMWHQHPERVKALVLSGTGFSQATDVFKRWVERYTAEGVALRYEQLFDHFSAAHKSDPILRFYADMVVELNNEGTCASIIAMNEANAHRPPEAFYRAITAPTLIMAGVEDRSYQSSVALSKLIPRAEFQAIEGVAHAPMIETPADYDRHAIAFLKKHGLFPG